MIALFAALGRSPSPSTRNGRTDGPNLPHRLRISPKRKRRPNKSKRNAPPPEDEIVSSYFTRCEFQSVHGSGVNDTTLLNHDKEARYLRQGHAAGGRRFRCRRWRVHFTRLHRCLLKGVTGSRPDAGGRSQIDSGLSNDAPAAQLKWRYGFERLRSVGGDCTFAGLATHSMRSSFGERYDPSRRARCHPSAHRRPGVDHGRQRGKRGAAGNEDKADESGPGCIPNRTGLLRVVLQRAEILDRQQAAATSRGVRLERTP